MLLTDFRSTLQTITKAKPDEVYNLAGQSSVALSFQQPAETMDSIIVGALNLLEAARFLGAEIRVYNASSSECFGNTVAGATSEQTPFTRGKTS
jgi:GDPmannose 4,6-dehydratase